MADFEIVGRVRLDTADLDSFGDRMGRTFKRVGVAIAAAFAIDKIKDVGLAGLKIAADFEQTSIAFQNVLGSGQQFQGFMRDLKAFALKTPFEFPGLAKQSQLLLGTGFAAKEVIPVMGRIGDLAAATRAGEQGIVGTVRALGQMKGRGKVTADELKQISESMPGFSGIAAIAKGLGVSTTEAFSQVTKGAVSADDGIRFILDGMAQFPGAAGAMDKQSLTLVGSFAKLKDTLSFAAIDFFTPYLPTISGYVRGFADTVTNDAVPAARRFVDVVTPIAGAIIGVVRSLGQGNTDAAGKGIGKLLGFDEKGTDAVIKALTDIKGGGEAVFNFFREHRAEIVQVFDALHGVLETVVSIIGNNLLPILAALAANFAVIALAGQIATLVSNIKSALFAFQTLSGAIAFLGGPVTLAAAAIALLVGGLIYAYTHFEGFRNVVDSVIVFVRKVFDDFAGFVREIWPSIELAISDAMANIQSVISVVTEFIRVVWSIWGDKILAVAVGIWASVKASVSIAIAAIGGSIRIGLALIHGDWGKAWAALEGTLSAVWQGIVDLLKSRLKFLSDVFFGGTIGLGKDVIDGLIKGVKDNAHRFIETIKRLVADAAPGFLSKVWESHSPSRVFMRIGETVPQGLAKGITSGAGDVQAALAAVTNVGTIPLGASTSTAGMAAYGDTHVVVNINGVSDAAGMRGVLPEIVDAVRAGVGTRR